MVINRASKFMKSIKTNRQHNEPNYVKNQRVVYSAIEYRSLNELEKFKEQKFKEHKNIREELKRKVLEINEIAKINTNEILKELGLKGVSVKNETTTKELMDSSEKLQKIKKRLVKSKRVLARFGMEEEAVKITQ